MKETAIQNRPDLDAARTPCEGRYLIDVLRAFWNDREPPRPPEGTNQRAFCRLVEEQRVVGMVADELSKRPDFFDEETIKTMKQLRALEIVRDVTLQTTIEKVEATFEENNIRYLPLKGAIMKRLYPRSYQRAARDYDVLIDESEMLRAVALLKEKLGYEEVPSVTRSHYALENDKGLSTVELHRFLLGRNLAPIFDDPWSRALSEENERGEKTIKYRFTREDFYLHMVSHLAKHWSSNARSIRMFVDLLVFDRKFGAQLNRAAIDERLQKAGLLEFVRNAERAANVWFGNGESDETVDLMERLVLDPTRAVAKSYDRTPKSRLQRLADLLLCRNYFQWRYLEVRQYPLGKRIRWAVSYWWKITWSRLKKGRILRRTLAFFRRRPVSKSELNTRREYERRLGLNE